MLAVNNELFLFDSSLAEKPQIVAVNKIDMPEVRDRMAGVKGLLREAGVTAHFISASTGEGVKELMSKVAALLSKTPAPEVMTDTAIPTVIRPGVHPREVSVSKAGEVYIVSGEELERLVAGSDTGNSEVRRQIAAILGGPRIRPRLERAGIKSGDKVRIGDFEWTW